MSKIISVFVVPQCSQKSGTDWEVEVGRDTTTHILWVLRD